MEARNQDMERLTKMDAAAFKRKTVEAPRIHTGEQGLQALRQEVRPMIAL
jgi:hypothetical protein